MSGQKRGIQRERDVVNMFRDEDWFAIRSPASLGEVDVICLRAGRTPRFIEVKSTAGGPYERFGPGAREGLKFAARLAGASAWLCWWPPNAKPIFIPESDWPT